MPTNVMQPIPGSPRLAWRLLTNEFPTSTQYFVRFLQADGEGEPFWLVPFTSEVDAVAFQTALVDDTKARGVIRSSIEILPCSREPEFEWDRRQADDEELLHRFVESSWQMARGGR